MHNKLDSKMDQEDICMKAFHTDLTIVEPCVIKVIKISDQSTAAVLQTLNYNPEK